MSVREQAGHGVHIMNEQEPAATSDLFRAANRRFALVLTTMQATALILIAMATAAAIAAEAWLMWQHQSASLGELLLLFLYVEILAMVKEYALGNRELPVRTPVIIAIVAVARYMILDVERLEPTWLLVGSVSIFLLTLALWVIHALRPRPRSGGVSGGA